MIGLLALAALVLSILLFAGMITLLVVLRRGEGPRFGVNREYDASRRDALRALTAEDVDTVPADQWFRRERKHAADGDPLAAPYRKTIQRALEIVVPKEHGLAFDEEGNANLTKERVWIVPAVSTADFRAAGLDRWDDRGRIVVGLVLFNPEPPGGATTRVTLPVQVLFGPLRTAGRSDLVDAFHDLAGEK